jgi:anti-sigma regulatory factor (Ser/Thr protein kinase)
MAGPLTEDRIFPPELNLEVLEYPCSIESLSRVRQFFEEKTQDLDLDDKTRNHLVSAVDEAATNAVNHGSSENPTMNFTIGVGRTKDTLIVTVKDLGGKKFDPQYFEDICQSKSWGIAGGRGIYMISNIMDEVMYLFTGGRSTTVCMIKYL